jgi:tetratricopeptide (TPR) repeat protein
LALAREALAQALAIDPDNAEAHGSLGWFALVYENDLEAASDHLTRATLLEPANDNVLNAAGALCWALGRIEEGHSISKYLVARDPLKYAYHHNIAIDYLFLGQPEKVIAAANSALTLTPDAWYMHLLQARALLLKAENEAALEAIQKEPQEHFRLFGLAMVWHALGRQAESDAAVAEFIEKYGQSWPYHLAGLLAYLGEADRAFEWLEKGASTDNVEPEFHLLDPMFANIHDDPRWLPFLESIGKAPAQLDTIECDVTLPK